MWIITCNSCFRIRVKSRVASHESQRDKYYVRFPISDVNLCFLKAKLVINFGRNRKTQYFVAC